MTNNLKAERTLTAESKMSDADWLDEAARYFEKRPTGGEDMAFWANVTNAERCRSIAKSLRAQSLSTQQPMGEVTDEMVERASKAMDEKFSEAFLDVWPDWDGLARLALNAALHPNQESGE